MAEEAQARPLLLTKGVNFTRLAVDRVSTLDQRSCNMLFIGTGTPQRLKLTYYTARYKPFGKSASSDNTSGRVHLDCLTERCAMFATDHWVGW